LDVAHFFLLTGQHDKAREMARRAEALAPGGAAVFLSFFFLLKQYQSHYFSFLNFRFMLSEDGLI